MIAAASTVYSTISAIVVPEAAAAVHCAVSGPAVVVAVVSGEPHAVVVARSESVVAGVARVAVHQHLVVLCLGQYCERTVLGVVPVTVVK